MPHWCALADLLRLSADDLTLLHPDQPVPEVLDHWHQLGVPLIVLTLGEQGAVASLRGERVTVEAAPVQVVDTVGAGDAFTAGLLHHLGRAGLLGGRLTELTVDQVADACRFAATVAGLTCSVAGANPPWAAQLPGR
jgi:fructokinase